MKSRLKIISGGQTGADRASLQFAPDNDFSHGGWCPKWRVAEDGVIPPQFQLRETDSDDYQGRTLRNVEDSDGTVIFSMTTTVTGGTAQTIEFAGELRKPLLHLIASVDVDVAATRLQTFLEEHSIAILNVAGPRSSQEPVIGSFVQAVLSRALTG